MSDVVYTIGHSTHPPERFTGYLKQHGITALCDVRSTPYSRMNPQFNRETLKELLNRSGIAYVLLGKELGGRSEDRSCYVGGKVQYESVARTDLFRRGLDRVGEGRNTFRIALMCAERDPLECHRTILVARHLDARGVAVEHILANGSVESHAQLLTRLLLRLGLSEQDMFRSRRDAIEQAYRIQGDRIAYQEDDASIESAGPVRKASK
jgi:uncharacterized protein (DUF488 family)